MRSRRDVISSHNPLNLADAPESHGALPVLHGLESVNRLQLSLRTRNRTEILCSEGQRLGFIELARYKQNGVVGLVVVSIERLQPFNRHVFYIAARAYGGFAVVVPQIGRRDHTLLENVQWRVLARIRIRCAPPSFRCRGLSWRRRNSPCGRLQGPTPIRGSHRWPETFRSSWSGQTTSFRWAAIRDPEAPWWCWDASPNP